MFNVYRLTHRLTGAVYVGATSNLHRRMRSRFNLTRPEPGFEDGPAMWDLAILAVCLTLGEAADAEARACLDVPHNKRLSSPRGAGYGLRHQTAYAREPYRVGPLSLFYVLTDADTDGEPNPYGPVASAYTADGTERIA